MLIVADVVEAVLFLRAYADKEIWLVRYLDFARCGICWRLDFLWLFWCGVCFTGGGFDYGCIVGGGCRWRWLWRP